MARLKKRYWIPLTILFFATALSLCGWGYWVSFKQQQGITVDWKNINISFDGLFFDEFTFTKQSLLTVRSKNLLISWSTLSATNVDIDWLSNDKSPLASMNSPFLAAVVFWLPNTINIDSLRFYQQNKEWFNIKINATKQQLTSNVVIGPGQSTLAQ